MGKIEKFDHQPLPQDYYYQERPLFEDESINTGPSLGNLLRMVLRRWYIILLVTLVGWSAGIPAVWYLVKETYFTEGAILVKPILTNIITGDPDKGEISNYQVYMNTQAELIRRDIILERVEYSLRNEQLNLFPPGSNPMRVLRSLLENKVIIVNQKKGTYLLKILMSYPNAAEAEKVVNAFLNSYMAVDMASEAKGGGDKLNTLSDLKKDLQLEIAMLQKQIKEKSQEYGMDDLTSRRELYLAKVAVLRQQITTLEMEEIHLTSQVDFLHEVQSDTISASDLVTLRSDYINADLELQKYFIDIAEEEKSLIRDSILLTEAHPDLVLKKEAIAALKEMAEKRRLEVEKDFDEAIAAEKYKGQKNEIKQAELKLKQTRHFLETFRKMLEREEGDTKSVGLIQLDIQEFKDKLKMDMESYSRVIQRIQAVELENKRPARVSIAYKANTTGPFSKRNKLMASVIMGSLIAGVMFAFLLGKMDPSLRTPEDVIRCIDLPIIGTTMGMRQIERDALPQQVEDDYQNIRANLGLFSGEGIPSILVVTSAGMQEGKTTFSINLATSMAKGASKVLLIDGDFRKPDVAHALMLNGKSGGLQKVLFGTGKIEDTVTHLPGISLDILSADPFDISGTFELLTRPSTAKLLREISQKYDHIIIDTAPLLAASDALLWAKMADATVLVSYSGHTAGPELKEAYDRLTRVHVRVLGTVLNSVQVDNSYHRYGYGYYGGKGKDHRRRGDENRPLLIDQLLPDEPKS